MDGNYSTFERAASSYWAKYLADAKSCQFPRSSVELNGKPSILSVNVELEHLRKLQALSTKNEAELVGVLHTAWALVLHCYTGSEDVCFGYQESNHATQARSELSAHGGPDSISAARLRMDEATSLEDLIESAKHCYTRGLQYLDAMPAEISRSLHSSEERLFNTTILLAKLPESEVSEAIDAPLPLEAEKLSGVSVLWQPEV